MNIDNIILKEYLKNCYFINGTSCAGKSTMCSMIASKFGLLHCCENYNSDRIYTIITPEEQPNLSYFNTERDWQEFLNRTPQEYSNWIDGCTNELVGFEIAELISISATQKVIVDTNIPCNVLKKIASYNQVAIMLSTQSMIIENFFKRDDEEKQLLLSEISKSADPEKTLNNFNACLAKINSIEKHDEFVKSGFFTINREGNDLDTREEIMQLLVNHFKF